MMRMPDPDGAMVVMGGRMTRMLGPGGAVVMVGGRMTMMLGLGSPGGSGGTQGVGRSLLFRLGWGRVRPFVVSLACAGLEVAGLGGVGFEEGVGCLLVRIPQWGFCRCLHFRFRAAAYDVGELAHGLRGICWPWQCGRAVVEGVV